jgi:hypothetical protein
MRRGEVPARRLGVATLLVTAALAFAGLGLATGLGSQFVQGGGETGQGSAVSQQALSYWTWTSTLVTVVPTPAPGAVSHIVTAPTRLPRIAGASYSINAATAGQASVEWRFSDATTAPLATELVITLVDGLSGTTSTLSAYVETSARVLTRALAFNFYWDAGAVAPTGLEISTMTATVQQCSAIGVCP